MSNIDAARFQMAYSLAFHMIFAALGVGMPLMMVIAEGLWLRTGKQRYVNLAKTWAKATGILFAIGAVSGTGLSFELGLLWPPFMEFSGSTIGTAFTLEGFAFFMEAIFLGLYLYGWDRLSRMGHWLTGIPVAISGAASSAFVVATNAWMQNPLQPDILMTDPEAADPAAALFANPYWAIEALHSTLACYAATGFAVAGVYAWGALKGRRDPLRMAGLTIAMAVGTVAAVTMPITGHISAQMVAVVQPTKLAAMEAHFVTQRGAPLLIGGIPNPETREVPLAFEIPRGLSILAFNDPDAEVIGLDQFPREDWPNVPLTHISFQIMVGAGVAMLVFAVWYWWSLARRPARTPGNRWLMWALVAASPMGFLALEAGWIVTEVGRQPWIIYGVMRTADAVTPAPGLLQTLSGFVLLYSLLAVVLVLLLLRLKHTETLEADRHVAPNA